MSIQVKVVGGLGNQMFLIATMLAISKNQNIPYYVSNTQQTTPGRYTFWDTVFHRLDFVEPSVIPNPTLVIKEENCNLLTVIPKISEHAVLDGYFQSEKYFDPSIISQYFQLPLKDQRYITSLYSLYKSVNFKTIFIHVRRGDYLQHQYFHIILEIEWYKRALKHFDIEKDTFFIFSEDKKWCEEHFSFLNHKKIFDEKDYIEMYLMAECDGGILSASTFSFWGAYLSKGNLFICPDIWFKDRYPQKYMRNCSKWIEESV